MKIKHIMTVFKKEVKDIIRDKKTILMSVLAPMIIIPLLNILVGGGVEKFQKDINENVTVALHQNSNTPEIRALVTDEILINNPNIKLIEVDDAVEAVKNEKVRAVLEIEEGYRQKLDEKKPFTIKVIYDETKAKSDGSVHIISSAIEQFNMKVLAERISALGEDVEILRPSIVERTNVADERASGNPMLMMMLPMMVGLLVVVGGIPAATDLIAGEKERSTFEPLLTTKPSRMSLLLGKYMTVTLFSFVSVAATLVGLFIGYRISPGSMSMGLGADQMTGFNLPVPALLLAVLISITLGMTFAGIQLALSTYARSFKEAQTYLSLLIFVAMIPGYATMFMQPNDIQMYMFFVPILNTISAFKMVLGGLINYSNLIIALVSSFIYVIISLVFAASLFNKEKVLFRS